MKKLLRVLCFFGLHSPRSGLCFRCWSWPTKKVAP